MILVILNFNVPNPRKMEELKTMSIQHSEKSDNRK